MYRCKRTVARLVTLLAGATPLAINATCDPRTGGFFFDRYDDDNIDVFIDDYFYDDGYFDGFWF